MASSLVSRILKEDSSETDQKSYRTCDNFSQDSLSVFVKPKRYKKKRVFKVKSGSVKFKRKKRTEVSSKKLAPPFAVKSTSATLVEEDLFFSLSLFDDKSPNEEEVVWEKISHDLWFKLNIQLGPGMDTELLIYEDSDPLKLSREFFYDRSIRVTEEALERVAHTISILIKARREKNQ